MRRVWVLQAQGMLAVEPQALQGVLELSSWLKLPLAPPWLAGVLAIRGGIAPLVDLASWLGWGQVNPTRAALLRAANQSLALVIEEVVGLELLPELPNQESWAEASLERQGQALPVLGLDRLLAHLERDARTWAREGSWV